MQLNKLNYLAVFFLSLACAGCSSEDLLKPLSPIEGQFILGSDAQLDLQISNPNERAVCIVRDATRTSMLSLGVYDAKSMNEKPTYDNIQIASYLDVENGLNFYAILPEKKAVFHLDYSMYKGESPLEGAALEVIISYASCEDIFQAVDGKNILNILDSQVFSEQL